MTLPDFELHRPPTLDEALALLARHAPHAQLLAGGTDLLPSLRQGLFSPAHLIDLGALAPLRGIRMLSDGTLEIGALTTLTAIENSALIRQRYAVLHQAAASVASPVLRNQGTLGGNLCLDTRCLWYNQSLPWRRSCGFCLKKDEPGDKSGAAPDAVSTDTLLCHVAPGGNRCWAAFSADTPPALLALDGAIEIASTSSRRLLPLTDFYTGDGIARLHLAPSELLTRVLLPPDAAGRRGLYRKLRVRGSIDYPLAGVAVTLALADPAATNGERRVTRARVALTAVNPAPLLVPDAEPLLLGRALYDDPEAAAAAVADLAARTAKPLTTSALTPEYRREMIRVFVRRALLAAA